MESGHQPVALLTFRAAALKKDMLLQGLTRLLELPAELRAEVWLGYRRKDERLLLVVEAAQAVSGFGALLSNALQQPDTDVCELQPTQITPVELLAARQKALSACDATVLVTSPVQAVSRMRALIEAKRERLSLAHIPQNQTVSYRILGNGVGVAQSVNQDEITIETKEQKLPPVGSELLLEFTVDNSLPSRGVVTVIRCDKEQHRFVCKIQKPDEAHQKDAEPAERRTLRLKFHTLDDVVREYRENISFGGLFVPFHEPLAVNSRVRIVLSLPQGEQIQFSAQVVYVVSEEEAAEKEQRAGCGVQFTLSQENKNIFQAYLDQSATQPIPTTTQRTDKIPTPSTSATPFSSIENRRSISQAYASIEQESTPGASYGSLSSGNLSFSSLSDAPNSSIERPSGVYTPIPSTPAANEASHRVQTAPPPPPPRSRPVSFSHPPAQVPSESGDSQSSEDPIWYIKPTPRPNTVPPPVPLQPSAPPSKAPNALSAPRSTPASRSNQALNSVPPSGMGRDKGAEMASFDQRLPYDQTAAAEPSLQSVDQELDELEAQLNHIAAQFGPSKKSQESAPPPLRSRQDGERSGDLQGAPSRFALADDMDLSNGDLLQSSAGASHYREDIAPPPQSIDQPPPPPPPRMKRGDLLSIPTPNTRETQHNNALTPPGFPATMMPRSVDILRSGEMPRLPVLTQHSSHETAPPPLAPPALTPPPPPTNTGSEPPTASLPSSKAPKSRPITGALPPLPPFANLRVDTTPAKTPMILLAPRDPFWRAFKRQITTKGIEVLQVESRDQWLPSFRPRLMVCDPVLREEFEREGLLPRCAEIITVDEIEGRYNKAQGVQAICDLVIATESKYK